MRGAGGQAPRGPWAHQKPLRRRDQHRMPTRRRMWPRSPKIKRRSTQRARKSGPKLWKPPNQPHRPTPSHECQGTSVAPPNQANKQFFVKPPNMAKEKQEISFTAANIGQRKTSSRQNLIGRNRHHARPPASSRTDIIPTLSHFKGCRPQKRRKGEEPKEYYKPLRDKKGQQSKC